MPAGGLASVPIRYSRRFALKQPCIPTGFRAVRWHALTVGALFTLAFLSGCANDKPFGGGFDVYTAANYAAYNKDSVLPQAAHSIYFSVLAEHGYVGLVLFLVLWALTFRLSGSLRRKSRGSEESSWVFHLASMCQVSLVGFAIGGAFLSLAYFDFAYNIIALLVVANRWIAEKSGLNEPFGTPASSARASQREADGLATTRSS